MRSSVCCEIDDVDAVALAVDESLHLRVPAPGLVAEVDAGLQELSHRDDRCHGVLLPTVRRNRARRPARRCGGSSDRGWDPAVMCVVARPGVGPTGESRALAPRTGQPPGSPRPALVGARTSRSCWSEEAVHAPRRRSRARGGRRRVAAAHPRRSRRSRWRSRSPTVSRVGRAVVTG